MKDRVAHVVRLLLSVLLGRMVNVDFRSLFLRVSGSSVC